MRILSNTVQEVYTNSRLPILSSLCTFWKVQTEKMAVYPLTVYVYVNLPVSPDHCACSLKCKAVLEKSVVCPKLTCVFIF